MGLGHSPSIITDGLVLCLDAANKRSYLGSGTVWDDLAGSNNGTLSNGPTFDADNGGSVVFDGTNDYAITANNLGITGNNPWSISFYFNALTTTSSRQWVFWVGANVQSTSALLSVGIRSQKIEVSHWANDTTFGNSPVDFGNFQNVAVTFDGSTEIVYLNGSQTDTRSATLSLTDGQVYLASRAGYSSFLNCKVGNVLAYNRALNADEIRQNYEATKGRYA
jgi:hypothetical protein